VLQICIVSAPAKTKVVFYHYNAEECIYSEDTSLSMCAASDNSNHVNWINIIGISDPVILQQAAELFKIHPLVMEDIANPNQRAKVEAYGDNMLYVVLRLFAVKDGKIEDQQASFVLRNNVLLTFREYDLGIFKKFIGDKLISGTGNLRKKGEDYLLYSILDVIIDNYYFVLEHINEQLEKLDHEILSRPDDRHIVQLQRLKGEVLYLRKFLLPVRDLIGNLIRNEIDYFEEENKYYLRDLQDHAIRDIEELDFQRDQVNSLMDLYYSLQTHKMNNVMKTLTSVSFVLLPLTFIASIYGMNFSIIPRADDPWGFYEVVIGMGILALFLVFFAFRRNWISSKDFRERKK
jgi:magnesium transporter